jgi:hypothetical protein
VTAVFGFIGGTAVYWGTAWIREQVAISRGSVILLLVEITKNVIALGLMLIAASLPPLALATLVGVSLPMALWAARLRREQQLYPAYGGQVASEDT